MKLVCMLMWVVLLSSLGFAAVPKSVHLEFKSCLSAALKKISPPQRDNAKFICLEKFKGISFSTCFKEARKMEYITNSEEAKRLCYYSKPLAWSVGNCLGVAKSLHTILDRDAMRLDCLEQLGNQFRMTQVSCLKIAKSLEQAHHKERFVEACAGN
jgi:hypothetical protein